MQTGWGSEATRSRRAVVKMLDHGVLAMNTTSSYPMNMENWPDTGMWWVAHKPVEYVENGVRAPSAGAFLDNLHILFQREASKGLDATYHFAFRGEGNIDRTAIIRNKSIEVKRGHIGNPDPYIHADSRTWIQIVSKETHA